MGCGVWTGGADQMVMADAERQLRGILPPEWRRLWFRMVKKGRLLSSLSQPVVADEKYLWRKLLDHDPRFVLCSDKLATKTWVDSLGLGIMTPRTLWVGTDPACMPRDCVGADVMIKVNHGSAMNLSHQAMGGDRDRLVARAASYLADDHGRARGEWGYGAVRRRVFAEERLFSGRELIDLKIYTFGPVIEQIVPIYRGQETTAAIWEADDEGSLRLSTRRTAVAKQTDNRPLPEITATAIAAAKKIGAYFDHVRVDFLTDGAALYLGELTIYNLAGRAHAVGHLPDAPVTRSWDLRRSWFLNAPQDGWRADYARALKRHIDARATGNRFLAQVPPIAPAVFELRYEDFAPN